MQAIQSILLGVEKAWQTLGSRTTVLVLLMLFRALTAQRRHDIVCPGANLDQSVHENVPKMRCSVPAHSCGQLLDNLHVTPDNLVLSVGNCHMVGRGDEPRN